LPSSNIGRNKLLDAGEYEPPDIGDEPPADEFAMTH
jgi:hypothetical protein